MSRRGENIHKRKDGRWEGRYKGSAKSDGTIHYISVYGRTYTECKNKLEEHKKSSAIFSQKSSTKTFGIILHQWLEHNKLHLKGATINKYNYMITTHILPEFENIRVTDISSTKINLFLDNKLKTGRKDGRGGLSPSYVKTLAIIIESALDFAIEEGVYNAQKKPINKPRGTQKKITVLSSEDIEKIEKINKEKRDLVWFGTYLALHTGMRIGEVCALTWGDIDLNEKIIHINHTLTRVLDEENKTKIILDSPKTEASKRDIPICSTLETLLFDEYTKRKSDFVVSEKNTFIGTRTFEYRYKQFLKNNNIQEINFHSLRHTFATRCVQAGVDIKSLSEILGHANVSITLNTYVHSSIETKRNQLEKLYI